MRAYLGESDVLQEWLPAMIVGPGGIEDRAAPADARARVMRAYGAELDQIQKWMQAVITHPGDIESGIASAEARAHIDVGPEEVERVVTRSRALAAADRLRVYGNAYFARLLECLREEFAVLAHALGEELFDEFASGYLQAYPSRSYTLNHLGANFPAYLAETSPAGEDDSGWTTFVIDLATLERIYGEVFDGPGVEGREPLSADALLTVPPARWVDACLVPAAGFRLVKLRSPVHEYITAVRRKEDPPPPTLAETLLAVHRRDYVVRRHRLTRPQFELLGAVMSGAPVGEAIGRAADAAGPDADALFTDLQSWFRTWAAEGLFQAVELPG
ncbi:MAG TPA: DNA-binding domain-containing protein [Gemmataceae bacterium]|nr:DNA-binding domain-containing protein [Gemmataceae bacterium]